MRQVSLDVSLQQHKHAKTRKMVIGKVFHTCLAGPVVQSGQARLQFIPLCGSPKNCARAALPPQLEERVLLYFVFLHTYTRHAVEYRHFHVENPLVSALASHSRETACKAREGHRTIWSMSFMGILASLLVSTNLTLENGRSVRPTYYIYIRVQQPLHPFETEDS